jgi:hypothetical protein
VKACEKAAIANAEIHAIEQWAWVMGGRDDDVEPWPECKRWRGDRWRFVVWPPSEKLGHSRFGGEGTNAGKVVKAEQREQLAPAESGEGL